MTADNSISTDIIELADLPLFWQGRANALRILDESRGQSDHATLEQAWAYEECAKELHAALSSGVAQAAPEPVAVEQIARTIRDTMRDKRGCFVGWETCYAAAEAVATLLTEGKSHDR